MDDKITVTVSPDKIYLSTNRIYKTDGFAAASKKTASIDVFISRVAESVIRSGLTEPHTAYCVDADDGAYSFKFWVSDEKDRLKRGDAIFYGFATDDGGGGVDRKLAALLLRGAFEVTLTVLSEKIDPDALKRLYTVSIADYSVDFPLMNEAQKKIVETEDSNMLVQGVAGSGKTNVCVEKIVYCACRNYRGRVLYTTFSRGLLAETRTRLFTFVKNIETFVSVFTAGNVVFLDDDHRTSIENKLGIELDADDDAAILASLERIVAFLKNNVDHCLIEDIYAAKNGEVRVADESTFINDYLGDKKSYRLSGALDKISHIAPELIYKEVYGMIFGRYEPDRPFPMTAEEYIAARNESFSRQECEIIHSIAVDYAAFLENNGMTDNNFMSRELINEIRSPLYSVCIIDEVQDFTQVDLYLMKKLSRKLFCVGDALQMINPAYFGFAYLKRLMYGEITGVTELVNNYRATDKLQKISSELGKLNIKRFGTHSFVIKGQSVTSPVESSAVFVKTTDFHKSLTDKKFEKITVVVASKAKKELIRKTLGKTEILTVAEAKGLERDAVILVDVLSDNKEKWRDLVKATVNRKTADENSVYRYYFNLFYVGVSRAKRHLFVTESDPPKLFDELFETCFERKSRENAVSYLSRIVGNIEIDDDELSDRIQKFCTLGQYDNAKNAADRIESEQLRKERLADIYVHEKFLRFDKYREAGVEYWRRGFDSKAREMFTRSGDKRLFPLMDACKSGGALDIDIVRFFPLVEGNELARNLILDTVKRDLSELNDRQRSINESFKGRKRK